ncbi:MAG: hypothetical protein AAGD01_19225 [Acidobacteriota bacterium]
MAWTRRRMVGWTTGLLAAAALLLLYWCFVFLLVEVFGLKVFAENLSQLFGFSILGILATMVGALIVNVALNFSRVADALENLPAGALAASVVDSPDGVEDAPQSRPEPSSRLAKGLVWATLILFPLTAVLLFVGDQLTVQQKKRNLQADIDYGVEIYRDDLSALARFELSRGYIEEVRRTLQRLDALDRDFPQPQIIQRTELDGRPVYLALTTYAYLPESRTEALVIEDYLRSFSAPERRYLDKVFSAGDEGHRFSAHDGSYEVFVPVHDQGETLVLYFSDYQSYGKVGS